MCPDVSTLPGKHIFVSVVEAPDQDGSCGFPQSVGFPRVCSPVRYPQQFPVLLQCVVQVLNLICQLDQVIFHVLGLVTTTLDHRDEHKMMLYWGG